MIWNPDRAVRDLLAVARMAGAELHEGAILVESLPAPHRAPTRMPAGKMAVYVFMYRDETLKVGKAGPNSTARYTNQHYSPKSAGSTLAASILEDAAIFGLTTGDEANIGWWIKENVDRVNILLDSHVGIPVLTLFESFMQCWLRPRYEGFRSQRL